MGDTYFKAQIIKFWRVTNFTEFDGIMQDNYAPTSDSIFFGIPVDKRHLENLCWSGGKNIYFIMYTCVFLGVVFTRTCEFARSIQSKHLGVTPVSCHPEISQ